MTITKQELVHWCAGGPKRKSRLARMLGCNRQLINRWTMTDTRIAERWQEELRTQMRNIELIERQHRMTSLAHPRHDPSTRASGVLDMDH